MAGKRKPISTYNTVGASRRTRERDPATQALFDEFARRLQAQMDRRGWSQSTLARECAKRMPKGASGLNRDSISHYIRGHTMPRAENLATLAKTLGVEQKDLVPPMAVPHTGGERPAFEIRSIGEDRVMFHCNRSMTMKLAMQITDLLRKEDAL